MSKTILNHPKGFRPGPYEYHEEITIEIQNLTNTGLGVGRNQDNWVVFVPFCIPGEKVKARIFRNHKNHSEADLIEILKSSEDRVPPKCKYYSECGGCQYQHIKYEEQLHWKKQQVVELLKHMTGTNSKVCDVVPSPIHYHYRSKITPHFNKPKNGKIGPIGFQQYGRRSLVDIDSCEIAKKDINTSLKKIRDNILEKASSYKKGATILIRSDINDQIHTSSDSIAEEVVEDIKFNFTAGSFFQNNPFILNQFTKHVRNEAKSKKSKYLIDAYCGAGLFALTSASAFEEVTGIEISEGSIFWAKKNLSKNSIENVKFITGEIEKFFEQVSYKGNETSVIIDPPRKGCSENFLQQLFVFKPQKVVYVSCNPATQMRDLNLFIENGYKLTRTQPFDLFPQTRHLECIMTLEKSHTI